MRERGLSLQQRIGMLFAFFLLVLVAGLSWQGNVSQQLIVHPIWRELLQASTQQYLALAPGASHWPATSSGPVRGWRVTGNAAPPGMPAYFASLAPGYYDEAATDAFEVERSHAVLVTKQDADRIVMAIDITDIEDAQNRMGMAAVLVAVQCAAMIFGSIVWLYRSMRRPIGSLARRMEALDPELPSQRLATDFALSELHDIAVIANRHLDRVERFIERERSLLDQASHEFRTPIAVIAGAVDVLRLYELPPAAHRPLERIASTTENLTEIMAALLFLSREPDGKAPVERVRLDTLVARLVEDHEHLLAGKEARFVVEDLAPLWLDCPEAIVRIVVGNLLRNAAENSFAGDIVVGLAGGRLRVQDSGAGFDTVAAARRYTQALRESAKQGGGQGLGLFLTRRICERFGWTMRITSDLARGTSVELIFP